MTFIKDIILEEGAIFIADSHFKQGDTCLLDFFSKIPEGKQVFLMGDIFHLLIGALQTSLRDNSDLIYAISKLSYTNHIIFLEGNHDFYLQNMRIQTKNFYQTFYTKNHISNIKIDDIDTQNIKKTIFKDANHRNIRIFSYLMQPIIIKTYQNHYGILAHGDLWITQSYDNYRKTIHNPLLISFFKLLDTLSCGIIYRKFANRVNQRLIYEFSFFRQDFMDFLSERIAKYQRYILGPLIQKGLVSQHDIFCIIEGHFHLGKSMTYENIYYNSLHSCYFHKKYFTLYEGIIIEVNNETRKHT